LVFALLLAVGACSGGQELAPVPSTTTTTSPSTTSTSAPGPTSSTVTTTTTTLPPLQGIAYQSVAAVDFPIQLTALPGSPVSYLITKDGRVWTFDGAAVSAQPVMDISGRVRDQGEQGLLSIALHPTDTGRFYLHYSAGDGDTVVAEYRFTDRSAADPGSERVLLRLDQPAGNHNGGMIQFGPDGILYLGLGDGGGANDQFGNGQNPNTLLAGLVAIDVDGGAEPVKFATGLRNPWRFWIEGDLIYVADVGQGAYEEVTVAPFQAGVNYGWPITEGLHCFRPSSGCDTAGLTLPVVEVSHADSGSCSITGGHVYRGPSMPELHGTYFYSDLCGGYLRSFRYDGAAADTTDWTDQVGESGSVVSFGIDGAGEMYVLTTGELLRVVPVRG
jgi:glucose/arabinose dehydrogenase